MAGNPKAEVETPSLIMPREGVTKVPRMKAEDVSMLLGDLTALVIDALRTKYGDKLLNDLCVRFPLYPAAGVALILNRAGAPECLELIPMIKGSVAQASRLGMSTSSLNCAEDSTKYVKKIIEKVDKICKEEDSEAALNFLSKEALKIPYLSDSENDILLQVLGHIPQLLVYSTHSNVEVPQNVILQTHANISHFVSRILNELRGELERCRGS